jgi:hypothetical protein
MPFETWTEVVKAAALGDEEATDLMAQELAGRAQRRAQQGESAQAEFQRLQGAYQVRRPDIFMDPEAAKIAEGRLRKLQAENPNTTLEDAFEEMVAAVDQSIGPGETRDASKAIEAMRRYRTDPTSRKALMESDFLSEPEREYEQVPSRETQLENLEHFNAVQEMIEARKPKANPFTVGFTLDEARKLKREGLL